MFDRNNVKQIRQRLQAHVEQLSKDLGCNVTVGNASYARDGSNCTFKIEMATIAADGIVETKEVSAFKSYATSYGLSPSDLGKNFTNKGRSFTICGLKPRASKYPIVALCSDGNRYKFSVLDIKTALSQEQKT